METKEQEEAEVYIQGLENCETKEDSSDVEKNKTFTSSEPIAFGDSNSVNNVTNESERVGIMTENNVQLVREAYLESLYQKAPTEGFCCPNCNTCIQKVLILNTEREETIQEIPENTELQGDKRLEILKSIVYGGLIGYIASLIIVMSAAGVDANSASIIALSAANLLGGIFILDLHIKGMKSDEARGNNEANESEDRYYKVLGKRENYLLHIWILTFSFIIFWSVPPLAYGFFTFYISNDNKDVTVGAVAAVSAICITLLSIAKAYSIQRPNTYLKTVFCYLLIAFVGSEFSYSFGGVVKGFLEKHGWFGSQSSSSFTLLPDMNPDQKPRFGSY